MNLSLIVTTILTSAADSVNPVAITQQFVLQGMVRKRQHIWFFIAATFLTNLACGMLAYCGLLEILVRLWDQAADAMGSSIPLLEGVAGISLLALAAVRLSRLIRLSPAGKSAGSGKKAGSPALEMQQEREKCEKQEKLEEQEAQEEQAARARVKSVRPPALFLLGTVSTVMELTSALPYFAFLGLLTQYRLSLPEVVLIQLLYNLIYTSPLMVLYLIYCKRQQLFDRVYRWVKGKMERIAPLVLPLLLLAAGAALAVHAAMALVG